MFQIAEFTEARLASVTNRVQKHGDEDVPAVSLSLEIDAANTLLDSIDPALRHALYKAVEGQEQLPGIEPATPVLRCNSVDRTVLTTAHEGWTLAVDDSINEAEPMVFGGAKVDKMSVEAKQGGTIVLRLRIGTSDIDADRLGMLGMHNGQSIWITIKPPEKPADAIDGTVGHPGLAAQRQEGGGEPDVTDLFAAGGDASITQEAVAEGVLISGASDVGGKPEVAEEQPADPERGTNWPFGTNSGADGTNEASGETKGTNSETDAFIAANRLGA